MKKLYAVALGVMLIGTACGDDDQPASTNNNNGATNNGTVTNNNGTVTNNNGTVTNNGMTTCTPLAECPVDTCGMIDDTCEGQLDCGECACDSGTSSEVTCGPCGLGLQTCDAGETGAGTCLMPEGLAEFGTTLDCESEVLFVDGSVTGPGVGSASDPFAELSSALGAAAKGSVIVVAAQDLFEKVVLQEGVHIFGGYDATGWVHSQAGRTAVLVSSGALTGHAIGLEAIDIIDPTYVSGLRVTTGPVQSTGMNNYAGYLVRANGVSLSRVELIAGRSAGGIPGSAGQSGAAGVAGGNAVTHTGATSNNAERHQCVTAGSIATALGSLIGNGAVATGCPATQGGNGGEGGVEKDSVISQLPTSGLNSAGGALGGAAPTGTVSPSGRDGAVGGDGTDGADGAGGLAVSAVVQEHLMNPMGVGSDGANGGDGIGGGGGGGAFGPDYVTLFNGTTLVDWNVGLSGGGGGSGGCAGTGGTGGTAGGASVGLFLYQSAPTLTDSTFTGGDGGNGANGGQSGTGGAGALGGLAATRFCAPATNSAYTNTYRAGAGGEGGDGGDGGRGAGGAGGASYGAYCELSQPTLVNVAFASGQGGIGGGGGNSGANGLAEEHFNCQ